MPTTKTSQIEPPIYLNKNPRYANLENPATARLEVRVGNHMRTLVFPEFDPMLRFQSIIEMGQNTQIIDVDANRPYKAQLAFTRSGREWEIGAADEGIYAFVKVSGQTGILFNLGGPPASSDSH